MNFQYSDATFDNELSKIEAMKWRPWIGKKYRSSNQRLVVLGESHYNWGDGEEDCRKAEARLGRVDFNRELIEHVHGIGQRTTQRFYRNVERLMFQASSPAVIETDSFWKSVAYFNLLQVRMENHKARPATPWPMCVKGWEVTVEICKIIKPTHILVGGSNACTFNAHKYAIEQNGGQVTHESSGIKKIGRFHARYRRASINSNEISFVFVRHPSAHFSWERWGAFLFKQSPDLSMLMEKCRGTGLA